VREAHLRRIRGLCRGRPDEGAEEGEGGDQEAAQPLFQCRPWLTGWSMAWVGGVAGVAAVEPGRGGIGSCRVSGVRCGAVVVTA
jgi:hypothetical protein